MRKIFGRLARITAAGGVALAVHLTSLANPALAESPVLSVVWAKTEGEQVLKTFSSEALGHLKATSSQEKDPSSGSVVSWKGPLLSAVIDDAIQGLSVDARAKIDLVVVKGEGGAQALIPRAVTIRYPVKLASAGGSFATVPPWTSRPQILQEPLPLETYFIKGVNRIELANSRDRFGSFFLVRRTDPAAMRGEKLFVQNCVSCHVGSNRSLASSHAQPQSHPKVKGFQKLGDKEFRAISSYLDAFRQQSQSSKSTTQ